MEFQSFFFRKITKKCEKKNKISFTSFFNQNKKPEITNLSFFFSQLNRKFNKTLNQMIVLNGLLLIRHLLKLLIYQFDSVYKLYLNHLI